MDVTRLADLSWLHVPTVLAIAVVVMVCVAVIMSAFGLTQRTYRGYWWWTSAMWLAPLGAVLMAARDLWGGVLVPGVALLLLWPVLIVTGLRRFHMRDAQFATPWIDGLLYAACYLGWLVSWVGTLPFSVRVTTFACGMLVLHLYAAVVVGRLNQARASTALKMLIGVLVVMGFMPLAHLAWTFNFNPLAVTPTPVLALGVVLPLTIAVLCTVVLCLLLTHERTVHDLRETQRQLRVLADIDMLTQVPNRRRIEQLAQRILGKMGTAPTVLMLFDIDHFKRINDSFGHATGDEALRTVARCARETLRTRDVIGRIGGDEFMLLLPGASIDHALQIADRITRRLDTASKGSQLPLSLSFGVVQFEPGETIEAAQARADQALYEAKRQGRKRAVPAGLRGRDTVFGESRPLGLDPLRPA